MNKDKMKKEISRLLDQMQEGTDDLTDSAQDVLDEAKAKAQEARRKAHRYIEENPERSVLVSAGIGAAVVIALALILKSKGCRHCKD